MKNKILSVLLLSFITVITISAQGAAQKSNPVGKWKFEAPYAPEGYTTGTVEVAFADNKYSASMAFAGSDYKFNGEKVKFENETLSFSLYLEGQDISVIMKATEPLKMTGKAVYSEGEIPLTMSKAPAGK